MSSFSPDSKSRAGRGDQSLIIKLSVFAAFLFVLDFRYFMLMLTLMLVFLSILMLTLYRRRGRHVFNFETPEHCEQEGENAQKGFKIQTSSKSALAFPSVSKSPHSIFTNSLHLKSQPISVSYPGFLFNIFLIQDFPFCIFHHFDR